MKQQSNKIPVPEQARKAVLDGSFASPLIRNLTIVRKGLEGDFDEEIYRLPAEFQSETLDEFYEKEAVADGWKKKEVQKSEVSGTIVSKWERGDNLSGKKRFVLAYVELDASHEGNRKFLAVYTEKN